MSGYHNYSYDDPNSSSPPAYQVYETPGYLSNTSSMTLNASQQSDSSYGSGYTQPYPISPLYSPYETVSGHQTQYSQPNYNQESYFAPASDRQPVNTTVEPTQKSKKAYPCLVPGCTSNSVFKRCADLERHMETVHFPKYVDCPYATNWCNRVGSRGFTRQDHLNDHLRDVHAKPIPKQQRGSKGKN